ncbi:MAG TPA: S41 family peptidase, partial [Gaiellaceae bacterium]|nr:S41 family peptidase [Gaiellaceae bacterium]
TLPWLLDPESAELAALANEAEARTATSPCGALEEDVAELEQLFRERHFGVATGRAELPPIEIAPARTWGGALGRLQATLRERLPDQHVRFLGTRQEAPRNHGQAFERSEVAGVLVLRIRRLIGDPDDERAFADWVAGADRDFTYDRIVVDLRGNTGGNDGHTWLWAERRLRAVDAFAKTSTWMVRGHILGAWNSAAWRLAQHGVAPPGLLSARHDPQPDDVIETLDESHDLPAGDRPWGGRMLVLVDGETRSSGESSAWLLREGLGARLLGEPTWGMIEFGNIVPYVLPRSGIVVSLPTKSNDYGFRVEGVGFPVDEPLDPETPIDDVARRFDSFI